MREESKFVISHDRQTFSKMHRSYFRAARWSRAAMVAFWVTVLLFFLWALPWFPSGMSESDYSADVILALVLLGCCPAVTAIALLARSIAQQRREALVAWGSIYDRATGLRDHEYFLDRLRIQCQLGRELAEYRAGVILIAIEEPQPDGEGPKPPDDRLFRLIGMSIAGQMRPSDLVAAIGSTELGVLVSAGSPVAMQTVAERIRRSLDRKLEEMAGQPGSNLTIRMGFVTLDDGRYDPEAILTAARSSLKLIRKAETRISAA